jgi:septum formation protein
MILCSTSITRANLLKKAGFSFIQKSSSFNEEIIDTKDPYEFVFLASYGKFKECLKKNNDNIIICADTVISNGKEILRKAKNKKEAKEILLKQSGKEIKIVTSMWIFVKGKNYHRIDETIYKFKKFNEKDLNNYLDSNEWKGKAGACMVEGFCKKYIESVRGYESTAMGLCIESLIEILKEENVY